MKPLYFKTYDQAVNAAKTIPNDLCVNQYQWSTEIKCAKVREFGKGYAVQLGDCGDYVTREFLDSLTK